jgi:hypothetical protein
MNWVGITKAPKWTEATTVNGMVIPAGIDGIISIDAKTNPKIARGVLLKSIFSNSVTVEFEWQPSHFFENQYEFEDKIGTIAMDGKMVTRDVTKILDYHETSLVWLGADPFAKLIDSNGELFHVDTASVHYKKAEEEKEAYKQGKKYYTFGLDKNIVHLSKFNQEKNTPMNKAEKLLAALKVMLKVADNEEITEESLAKLQLKPEVEVVPISAEQLTKVAAYDALASIKAIGAGGVVLDFAASLGNDAERANFTVVRNEHLNKLREAEDKCVDLASDNVSLTKDANVGRAYLKMKRDEVVRQYKLMVGDQQDTAVITLMENAESAALDGLLKQYTKGATEKFSGKCKSCGSDEFEFRSSIITENEKPVVKAASVDEIHFKFSTGNKMNITKKP